MLNSNLCRSFVITHYDCISLLASLSLVSIFSHFLSLHIITVVEVRGDDDRVDGDTAAGVKNANSALH